MSEELTINGKACILPDKIRTAGQRNKLADKIKLWSAPMKNGQVDLILDSIGQKEIIKSLVEPAGSVTDEILDAMDPVEFDRLFAKCVPVFLDSFAKTDDKKK